MESRRRCGQPRNIANRQRSRHHGEAADRIAEWWTAYKRGPRRQSLGLPAVARSGRTHDARTIPVPLRPTSYQRCTNGLGRILRCRGAARARDPCQRRAEARHRDQGLRVDAPAPRSRHVRELPSDFVETPSSARMPAPAELERRSGDRGRARHRGRTGIFLHLARERGWDPYGVELCARPHRATRSQCPSRSGTSRRPALIDGGSGDECSSSSVPDRTGTELARRLGGALGDARPIGSSHLVRDEEDPVPPRFEQAPVPEASSSPGAGACGG